MSGGSGRTPPRVCQQLTSPPNQHNEVCKVVLDRQPPGAAPGAALEAATKAAGGVGSPLHR